MSLMTLALVHRQLLDALDYAEQGIAFCKEHDLDLYTARLYVRRRLRLYGTRPLDEVANDLRAIGRGVHRHASWSAKRRAFCAL